jgi:hypothetical protein
MGRFSFTTWTVVVLAVVAGIFVVYSIVLTPRMDRGVSQMGYRPPIQDQATPSEIKQPLQKSNVPPPG